MVELQIGLRERGSARCPFCRDDIHETDDTVSCKGCKAVLHRECADELPRCPIHGCRKQLIVQAPQRTRRRLSNAPANQPGLLEVLGIGGDDARRHALVAVGIVVPMLMIGGCFSVFDQAASRRKRAELARARRAADQLRQRQEQLQRRMAEERAREAERAAASRRVEPARSRVRSTGDFSFATETEGTPGLLFLRGIQVAEPVELEVAPGVIAPIGPQRFVIREEASFRLDPGQEGTVQLAALSLDLERWRTGSSLKGSELRPPDRNDVTEQRALAFVRGLAQRVPRTSWLPAQVALLIVVHDPTPDELFGPSTEAMRRAALNGAKALLSALGRPPSDFQVYSEVHVPARVLAPFTPAKVRYAQLPRSGAFAALAPYRRAKDVRRLLGSYAALPLWPGQLAEVAELLRGGGGLPEPAAALRRRLSVTRSLGEAWVLLDSLILAKDEHGIAGALEWAEDSLAGPLLELLRSRLGAAGAGLTPTQLVRAARRARLVRGDSPLVIQQRAFRSGRRSELIKDLRPWRASRGSRKGSAYSLELLAFHFPRDRETHTALVELARSPDSDAATAAARGLAHLLAGGSGLEVSARDLLGGQRPASAEFRVEFLRALSEEAPKQLAAWIGPVLDAGVSKSIARGLTSALVKRPQDVSVLSRAQLVGLLAADPVTVRLLRHVPAKQAAAALLQPEVRPLRKATLSRLAYENPLALSLLWGEELGERERLESLEAIERHGPRSSAFAQLIEHLARRWKTSSEQCEQRRLELLAAWSWRVEGESAPLSEAISDALADPSPERRRLAARLNLSKATLKRLLPLLRRRLEFDPEPQVRRQLLLTLSMNRVRGCDRVAQRWLEGSDKELRRAAAWAMSLYPWLGAERFLPKLLADPDPEVRRSAELYKTRSGGGS